MTPLFKYHRLLAVAIAALFIGCSGGESGTGIQAKNQTTSGQITGFGSIYVNGIKFNTDQAIVKIDGADTTESNLSVGMVVTVIGSVNNDGINGTASEVYAKTEVEGLVFQNNLATDGTGTISVMHQVVNISNDTKFKSEVAAITTIDQLVENSSVVEVSGYSDGQGKIYATLVNVVSNDGLSSEVKLHGVINSLSINNDSGSFQIGMITVSFDSSTNYEGFISTTPAYEQLAEGMYVSVESANFTSTDTTVLASEIELESFSVEEGSEVEVEGIVTNVDNIALNEFMVNGQRVKFDAATSFSGGNQSNIVIDVKVDVEGVGQPDGSILADEISFRQESDTEIDGIVQSIGSNTLVINGEIDGVPGVATVTVNELTSYVDETNEQNHTFNFDDIAPGMTIDAKVYVDPDLGYVATRIEKVDAM